MNTRTLVTLAVAILLGLIAVIMVRSYIGGARRPAPTAALSGATVSVVVAAQPIARGQALDAPLLKVVRFPQEAAPQGAFATVADLMGPPNGPNGPTGKRLAMRSYTSGEPILASQITGPGGRLNLSAALTPGMRAVSIRSNDVAGVAGFVLPGDHVDVLLTRTDGAGEGATTVTQALAENVRVVGVDQSDNDEADKPVVSRAVTLEVTPEQAQTISLAQAVGAVSLSLRQVADAASLTRRATTVADLGHFGARGAPPRPVRAGPPRGFVEVRVTRGVETSGYPVSAY
jgi:pilus assembly protein CpaB